MIGKIKLMVREFSEDAIINNPSIPNDKNEIAIETTTWSLMEHFKDEAISGYGRSLLSIFKRNDDPDLNPSVNRVSNRVAMDLAKRLDIDFATASRVVGRIIPSIIIKLRDKIQNPDDHDFDLHDLLQEFSKEG